MKDAPAEIFANSPSLYIFGFGIFVKGIMQLFSAKRKSTCVFRAEQQCVDRILCNAEHFFTGLMFVFDDKRNFFTGSKRRTVNCSDSGKQLCAVQRSIGAESEANLLRMNGEIQNTELSCAGFIQCNIQQILD